MSVLTLSLQFSVCINCCLNAGFLQEMFVFCTRTSFVVLCIMVAPPVDITCSRHHLCPQTDSWRLWGFKTLLCRFISLMFQRFRLFSVKASVFFIQSACWIAPETNLLMVQLQLALCVNVGKWGFIFTLELCFLLPSLSMLTTHEYL